MALVGEAEILITANTAEFKGQLAALDTEAAGSLGAGATVAGEGIGADLAGGLSVGARDIGKDTEKHLEESTGRMQGIVNDFSKKASNTLSSFGVPASLLSGPKVAALGLAAIGAVSIKLGSDMQKADASIATSAGITVKSATAIGDAFLNTGGKVEYSGIKQAQAFAGVAGELKAVEGQALTTAQAQQFMSGAMDLATASGEDLTTTTKTLGGVMQAFQIPINQTSKAADTLFNASRTTGIGIDTLASSVERVKARLGDLAPPLKDLSALMVDLTHNGITGRGALTALQGSYNALVGAATGTSKANLTAKQTLAEYGVQVINAKGQLTPMSTIIEKLAPKFATMTQQQQLATATLIFGASAAKQMTAVIDAGTASYAKATTAVNQSNTASKAAATQQDTLSGKMKILGAIASDDGTRLGGVLVPALTDLASAALPVVKGIADVVGWFEKGSTAAHGIEIVLATILAPALIKMGVDATTSAAKAVVAFVTMGASAKTQSTEAEVAIASANDAIVTSQQEVDAALLQTRIAAKEAALGISTSAAESATAVEASATSIEVAAAAERTSLLSLLGPIGLVAGAALGLKALSSHVNILGETNSSAAFQAKYDNYAKSVKTPKELEKLNKFAEGADKFFGYTTVLKTSIDANTAAIKVGAGAGYAKETAFNEAQSVAKPDAYIAPINTAAAKAKAEAEKKAAEAAKSAGAKAESAAKAAAAALTSEVLKAITLPANEAKKSLEALGVPATKAAQVLKDAAEPFSKAIAALEKEGFNAADAVRIAEAGSAEVAKEAKAAAAAAKKNATAALTATVNSLTALTVNGIQVSGSVYRAAIGAAYKIQTGQDLNAGLTTPSFGSAPVAPVPTQSLNRGVVLNMHAGAVVINPAPGNDAASLVATKGYVDNAFRGLTNELHALVSGLVVVK